MTNNHGGKRKGAGSGGPRAGSGRKRRRFTFDHIMVIEREILGGLPSKPKLCKIHVHEDHIEITVEIDGTSEIITIRRADN